MREAILAIPHEYFDWDERKLIRYAYDNNEVPEMDERLRLAFWSEYDRCFEKPMNMVLKNIFSGICSQAWLEREYYTNNKRLMFIITEPFNQKKTLLYAHHLAFNEMIKLIKAPVGTDAKTGLPDARMYAIKEKLFEYLNEKVNGSTTQKVEINQKSLNVNATLPAPDTQAPPPQTPEEMEARVASLLRQLESGPQPTVIMPTESVIKEAGRVVDAEFINLRPNRDNSHRE